MELNDFYDSKPLTAAQKKKLKKKQRQLEIDLEKDAATQTNSSRALEEQSLRVKLAIYGFEIYSIPGDGNCLYRSIAHQIDPNSPNLHEELRIKTAKFILDNREEFSNYISEDIEIYVDKVANTCEWGGEIEILALSRVLNRKIFVHSNRHTEPICHGQHIGDSKHPQMGEDIHLVFYESAYLLGGHYNSVIKL